MAATITVTKQDDTHFVLTSSEPINGPAGTHPGGKIPVSWLLSFLEYYQKNAGEHGLSEQRRASAPW